MPDEIKFVKGFACRCSNEGKDSCGRDRLQAKEFLGADDSDLVDRIVWDLHIHYGAEIVSIATDQWHGVEAATWSVRNPELFEDREKWPQFRAYFECDTVEDGFVAVWCAFKDNMERRDDI